MLLPTVNSVVVVDAWPVVRRALSSDIALDIDLDLIGEAASGGEAIALVAGLRPKVVVIDVDLPDQCGFDIIDGIREVFPVVRIVVFTGSCRDQDIERGLGKQIAGYVSKTSAVEEVLIAIRRACNGGQHYCGEIASRLVRRQANAVATNGSFCSRLSTLTGRETTVLRQLALGHTVKSVASALQISPKTVDNHKTRLMAKLALHDRVSLCRYAVKEGLVRS